jgi:hypothetical protein
VTAPTEWRFVGAEFCTPKQHPQVEDALTKGEVGTRIGVVIKKAIHDWNFLSLVFMKAPSIITKVPEQYQQVPSYPSSWLVFEHIPVVG